MKIAIVGATGLVGRKMLEVIEEFSLTKNNEFVLYSSKKSAGTKIMLGGTIYEVIELTANSVQKVDIALFSAGSNVSLNFARAFAKKGAFVIDNSSCFRRKKYAPLVVPEINANTISANTKIIANPNCSTIGLVLPLYYIGQIAKIKRVIVTTFQAVSGAGTAGIFDLQNSTMTKFAHQITNNLIPAIDIPLKNGYTKEEDKVIFETQKILNKKFEITATAVRVPILNCHSEAVNIEFEKPISLAKIKNHLTNSAGIVLYDDLQSDIYPMPKFADNQNNVFVGRIRKDTSNKNAINLFLSFDNIRKGAATNAVQIAKFLIDNNFVGSKK